MQDHTVVEASKRCHVTPLTIRRWISEGKFGEVPRVGHQYLIPGAAMAKVLGVEHEPEDYVTRLVEAAPALSQAQLDALRVLLGGDR